MNIIDFAREIGVSPTTVSRALSGRGRISESTRQMIKQRMVELGYTPNPHAQSLVTGRSRMILLHHSDRSILSDMFLVEMAHGVQQALEKQGYGLLLDTAHVGEETADNMQLNQWITSRAVDGAIVKPMQRDGSSLEPFIQSGIPCVMIGDPSMAENLPVGVISIRPDAGMRNAANLLMQLGHRRIGFIGTSKPDLTLDVFRAQLLDNGVEMPDEYVVYAGLHPDEGARAIHQLLMLPAPPTAVFVRLDTLAIGAIHAASRLGIRVPEHLSIIGYGDIPLAGMLNPPLTTVKVDFFGLGKTAMGMLFDLIENPSTRLEPQYIETALVVRDSVAAVKA